MFNLQGLDHIAITVSDLERSVKWYQDVLGMERHYADVWGDVPAMMMVGGSGIALFRAKTSTPKPQTDDGTLRMRHLAFRASRAEFDKAQEALRQRGIDFEFSDHTVSHSIYFYDPDRHEIEITTYEV
jgi:catechol 2,3-dioxygenase-like lactoylglutathione lyase family enzyme